LDYDEGKVKPLTILNHLTECCLSKNIEIDSGTIKSNKLQVTLNFNNSEFTNVGIVNFEWTAIGFRFISIKDKKYSRGCNFLIDSFKTKFLEHCKNMNSAGGLEFWIQ